MRESTNPLRCALPALLVIAVSTPARCEILDEFHRDGLWGLRDAQGEEIEPARYELLERVYLDAGGRVLFLSSAVGGLVVRIDSDGEGTVQRYDTIERTNWGTYLYRDGKVGLITRTGRVLIPVEYDHIQDTHLPPRVVGRDGLFGLIEEGGRIVLPVEYSHVEASTSGVRRVEKDGRVGLVEHGGRVILPAAYEDVAPSVTDGDGWYRVQQAGKWGVADGRNRLAVPARYDTLDGMVGGIARFTRGSESGFELEPFEHTGRGEVAPQTMPQVSNRTGAEEPLDPRLEAVAGAIQLIALPHAIPWHLAPHPGDSYSRDIRDFMTLYVTNTTADVAYLEGMDGDLLVVQEALDAGGEWRPIEYGPEATCGLSHYPVVLAAGHQRPIRAPRYGGGDTTTQLRFTMAFGDTVIHSNEFEGTIDLNPFERAGSGSEPSLLD